MPPRSLRQVQALKHITTTSGVLSDQANGMYSTDVIYSDMDIAQIESLPPTAVHRNVDLAIVEADQQGYVRTYTSSCHRRSTGSRPGPSSTQAS
ncbi:hypothetical protein AcV7_003323 [Taiwanofungus camphoratus]|nr:hypothetical protein AcV7_003323 [Antrodia cinnamomea]